MVVLLAGEDGSAQPGGQGKVEADRSKRMGYFNTLIASH
jgi:hypothetical protein